MVPRVHSRKGAAFVWVEKVVAATLKRGESFHLQASYIESEMDKRG